MCWKHSGTSSRRPAGTWAQWCEPAEHGTFSHLTLCSKDFLKYHCDHMLAVYLNLVSISIILKCVDNNDIITLRAEDNRGTLVLRFEAPNLEKVSDYGMKLMNWTPWHPKLCNPAMCNRPSSEFAPIGWYFSHFGDTVVITCANGRVKFSARGEGGNGNIKLS